MPTAKRETLNLFALTLNPLEIGEYGQQATDLKNASAGSTLVQLRAHLFFEQRRWNHFGEPPDPPIDQRLREIVRLIRLRLGDAN